MNLLTKSGLDQSVPFLWLMFCLVLAYDTQDVGIIIANVSDEDSLNAMCSKAQIILNCVGPVSWIFELVMGNNYYPYINDYVLLSLISSVVKDMRLVCLFVRMLQVKIIFRLFYV